MASQPDRPRTPFDHDVLSTVGAGSDTVRRRSHIGASNVTLTDLLTFYQSASAISIAIMAAAVHPEAQRRVQAELDEVVGRDRCKYEPKEAR